MLKEEDLLGNKKKSSIRIYEPLSDEAEAWSEAIVTGTLLPYAKYLIFFAGTSLIVTVDFPQGKWPLMNIIFTVSLVGCLEGQAEN